MELSAKIEAVLFWKGEPMSRKKLAEILDVEKEKIDEALEKLKNDLINRGIVLLEKGDSISPMDGELTLGTAPELSKLFEKLQKEELNKDLSKATLETLSIVLYKNGASRQEIDYIRGVNSSFILRALSVRGLVEKTTDAKDNRKFIYKPTFDLLSFMGVKSVSELPDYGELENTVQKVAEEFAQEDSREQNENQ